MDLVGKWSSNIGLTYDITLVGGQYQWRSNDGLVGTISFSMSGLSTTWSDAGGTHTANGLVQERDADGRPTRIAWDNGVVFFRESTSGQQQPQTKAKPPVDISGDWSSNIGLTYRITQQGDQFQWQVLGLADKGQGTVNGSRVTVQWTDAAGSHTANGQAEQYDASGKPALIRFDNGVELRSIAVGQPGQVQTPGGGPAGVTPQSTDIAGDWNSNIGAVYRIVQNGQQFQWSLVGAADVGQGTITGKDVTVSWTDAAGSRTSKGVVTELDSAGRPSKMMFDVGIELQRVGAGQPGQVQTPAGGPAGVTPQSTDIAGDWNSNIGAVYRIVQSGQQFQWQVVGVDDIGQGTITGKDVSVTWTDAAGSHTSKGVVTALDSAGRPSKMLFDVGVEMIRVEAAVQGQQPQFKQPGQQQAQSLTYARLDTATLNQAVAMRIQQTATVASSQELIQTARTAAGLATLGSRAGVSAEKILFLANELELRSALGDVTPQEMEMLKELDLETVRNIADFSGRPEVLQRILAGIAQERGAQQPSLQRISTWVTNATAMEAQSLPPARQLLQQARFEPISMEAVRILDAAEKRESRMLTVNLKDQPLIAVIIQPGQEPGSFLIKDGEAEYVTTFVATKPGLYCARVDMKLPLQAGWVEMRCFVDQPELAISLNNMQQTVVGNIQRSIIAQPQASATATVTGYKPLIEGGENLRQDSVNYFLFWLAKKDIPLNGQLRFRVRVMRMKTAGAEPGKEDFTTPPTPPEKHPPINGVLKISHVPPFQLKGLSGTTILPSSAEVGSPLLIAETPLFQAPAKKASHLPTYLTFMVSHAPKLSTQISNEEIYKIYSAEHPGGTGGDVSMLRDEAPALGVRGYMKYLGGKYAMDLPSPAYFLGVEVIDIKDPSTGIYRVLLSPDPEWTGVPSFEMLSTTGWVMNTRGLSSATHELHVTTRDLQTSDRYVVELVALEVSGQSEPDDDGNDEGYGEFKITTSTMLSQRKPFADLEDGTGGEGGYPLMLAWTRPFPVCPEHRSQSDIHIRTDSKSYRHICFPHMPIIDFSDDWLVNFYKDLAVNVTVIEDDSHTWWQENMVLFTRVFNFFKSVYKVYSNPGSLLGEIQSGLLPLFNSSLGLDDADDKIGSPGLVTSVESKWGLWNESEYYFDAKGPRDVQYFQNMTVPPSGDVIHGNVTGTTQSPWARAFFRIKRYPQVFGWADIQLVGFTLRESTDGNEPTNLFIQFGLPEYRIIPGYYPVHWEQASEWKTLYFDALPGVRVKVADPTPPKTATSQDGYWLVPESSKSLDAGILETDTLWTTKEGFKAEPHVNPMLRGYTYFQSTFWDDDPGANEFLGVASFTLYHDDVWKYAGQGPQVFEDGRVTLNSYKPAGSPFYVAEITINDPGTWMKTVEYVAYVYIAE